MALIQCPECGKQVSDLAMACPGCGNPMQARTSQTIIRTQAVKSRSTAAVLSLFLGGIGAHKFYVGKPGVGLLYALFCWTWIPLLFGLFEALQYISMSDVVFQEKLVKGKL